jgi:hypothetical protein
MATMDDLDRFALELPETTKAVEDGRPSYLVHGKWFCFHRKPRKDAVDPETGERLADVLVFRVEDAGAKELQLRDARGLFFTTPHWNGFPAVLLRSRDLGRLDVEQLREVVEDAWLTRAQKRVAKKWLAEQEE